MQPSRFSPDGQWWWDGWQWAPAYPPDRRWRFDGSRWVPAVRRQPPGWLVNSGLAWLLALSSWVLTGFVFAAFIGSASPAALVNYLMIALAAVPVLATCAWGFLVGRRRATRWLWPAAALGTGTELGCYVLAILATPDQSGTDDLSAGAGVAILAVPVGLAILALLWLGAGLGLLSLRRRPQT